MLRVDAPRPPAMPDIDNQEGRVPDQAVQGTKPIADGGLEIRHELDCNAEGRQKPTEAEMRRRSWAADGPQITQTQAGPQMGRGWHRRGRAAVGPQTTQTQAGPRTIPASSAARPRASPVSVSAVHVADSGGNFFTVVYQTEVTEDD